MKLSRLQFQAYLQTRYDISSDLAWTGEDWETHCTEHASFIERWYEMFYRELYDSRLGYPQHAVFRTPELEDLIEQWIEQRHLRQWFVRKTTIPTIALTHDVDYLAPTAKLRLKNLIGRRNTRRILSDNYLDSLEELIKLDLAQQRCAMTVFLATQLKKSLSLRSPLRSIIDPSYTSDTPYYRRLLEILRSSNCEIGLHGSIDSISYGFLKSEKMQLENEVGTKILSGRQHWLHLPGKNALRVIFDAGIAVDSTLGWNGQPGFRGGISHPFPIVLSEREVLWEVPLLLMDGPLFQDLRYSPEQAFDVAKELLTEVFSRGGTVAINWHERAASLEYGWDETYRAILSWATERGFRFSRISDAVAQWKFPLLADRNARYGHS